MMRIAAILALLLCAAHAQARNLYVSLTGSHDTNAPAFSTWATAATNIQSAIDAASAGDTVRVAPGTYPAAVAINKNSLTVQGGNGTLWDADRTFIDLQGEANSIGVTFVVATNSTLRGFTVTGARPAEGVGAVSIASTSTGCVIESCVVRGNQSAANSTSGIRSIGSMSEARNCIVVGNHAMYGGVSASSYLGSDGFFTIQNCIVEANANYQAYLQNVGRITAINCVLGNAFNTTHAGGNVTNNTTNSVCRVLNIAPASEGVGTNLVWAGVAAYIPRIGSLAQGAGVGYTGIDAAKSGDGGPALWPPFGEDSLGRDSSTNANHGLPIGGVKASTNSPLAGGGSAEFAGVSRARLEAGGISSFTNAITVELWINPKNRSSVWVSQRGELDGPLFSYELNTISSDRISWRVWPNTVLLYAGYATNEWHHFAAVFDGKSQLLYRDSTLIASNAATTAMTANSVPLSFGNRSDGMAAYDAPLSGFQSQIRIWNVARTPSEIAANYTNTLTGTEAGLVGYWRLDERDTPITTGPFNLRNPLNHPTYMEAF